MAPPNRRVPGEDDEPTGDTIDLRTWDEAFIQAPDLRSAPDPPDGCYHARLERVELRPSRFSVEPMLTWTLQLLGRQGRRLFRHQVIRASLLGIIKHDLRLCGLELERLSDLPAHLDRLRDIELQVTLRTVGRYQRVYFERRLSILSFP